MGMGAPFSGWKGFQSCFLLGSSGSAVRLPSFRPGRVSRTGKAMPSMMPALHIFRYGFYW